MKKRTKTLLAVLALGAGAAIFFYMRKKASSASQAIANKIQDNTTEARENVRRAVDPRISQPPAGGGSGG